MVIDIHAHPVIYGAICQDKETVAFRKQNFGLYKSSPTPMEQIFRVLDHAGVDKTVLLAEDYSSTMGKGCTTRISSHAKLWKIPAAPVTPLALAF